MALKITDNFNYTGRKPNFQRDQFATTSEMNAYTVCDEGHISYNLLDNKHYSFKNGAWSVLQTGGGGSSYTHPSSHPASIITYDSSETYESGNVGYEIKQLVTSLAAKYVKPGTGIPKADLANDVLTSLDYADDYNTNKSSFVTSTALETALTGLSPYSAGTGISITTVSNGKLIAVDTAVYKVKDVLNASGTSLVTSGIATIPITSIKDSGGNDLAITNGAVTLPSIPADQSGRIKNIEDTLQQIANAEPIVIPVSAVELPTSANSTITYDSDNTYVMNVSGTQIATVHYPYEHNTNSYLAFKAIDRDLYYVYQLTNTDNNIYTFVEQHTYDELSHEEAKAVFEAGKYAVKQVIDVNNNGKPLPNGNWKHGIPSVFVTPHGYPLRYNQIKENNVYYILLKCDEVNKIFKYSASNNKWSLVSGGCYTKDDPTTGENYTKYDAYFDRQPASNVSFDDSVTQLGTQENPVNNMQDAIQVIVSNVTGTTGRLTVSLQYSNTIGIANKKCKIVVYYQGVVYKPNTFPVDDEFTTDSNGNIILNLPLGSTYTITPIDIEDYITPEGISGIVDDNFITKSLIYNAVSNNERILFVVNIKNVSPQITVNNKKLYIDVYDPENLSQVLTEKAYTCTLGNDGTPKLIEDHLGNTIATGTTLYFEISKGIKIKAYLQTWDGTDSLVQEYIKSSDVIITTNKNKDVITFYYSNVNYGLYLLLKDSTKEKGYSKNKILEVDSTNNRFTCNIAGYNYIIYKENSKVYRILEGTSEPEEWLSNTTEAEIMLGVGICSSQTNAIEAKDDITIEKGFLTLDFFVPRVVNYQRGALVNGTTMPIFDYNDGMYITRRMAEYNETIRSEISQNAINNYIISLPISNNNTFTIEGFIPSRLQMEQLAANCESVAIITNIFSGVPITRPVSITPNTFVATNTVKNSGATMTDIYSFGTDLIVMNSWTGVTQAHQFYTFYPFA